MSNVAVIDQNTQHVGIVATMANRFGMVPKAFEATLRATVVPAKCSKEQFAAFLLVANQYNLNPITKEIYAFPSRGGIAPIVSIDGWMKLMNEHPDMDGLEFKDNMSDDGSLISITCRVFRKDRSRPIEVTEYLAECKQNTDPWEKWPARMLRHKAAIQAARYAFGFSGIMDPDEYDRFNKAPTDHIRPDAPALPTQSKPPTPPAPPPAEVPIDVEPEPVNAHQSLIDEFANLISGMESVTDIGEQAQQYKDSNPDKEGLHARFDEVARERVAQINA